MAKPWKYADGKDHYGDPNPYYDPADCGLDLVDTLEMPDLSYAFDYFCLWRDKDTGRYYYASDSGCSCPSPFEDYHSLDDLNETPNRRDLRAAADAWNAYYGGKLKVPVTDIARFCENIPE